MRLDIMGQVVNCFWIEFIGEEYLLKQVAFDQDDQLIFQANLMGSGPDFKASSTYQQVKEFCDLIGASMYLTNPTENDPQDN